MGCEIIANSNGAEVHAWKTKVNDKILPKLGYAVALAAGVVLAIYLHPVLLGACSVKLALLASVAAGAAVCAGLAYMVSCCAQKQAPRTDDSAPAPAGGGAAAPADPSAPAGGGAPAPADPSAPAGGGAQQSAETLAKVKSGQGTSTFTGADDDDATTNATTYATTNATTNATRGLAKKLVARTKNILECINTYGDEGDKTAGQMFESKTIAEKSKFKQMIKCGLLSDPESALGVMIDKDLKQLAGIVQGFNTKGGIRMDENNVVLAAIQANTDSDAYLKGIQSALNSEILDPTEKEIAHNLLMLREKNRTILESISSRFKIKYASLAKPALGKMANFPFE